MKFLKNKLLIIFAVTALLTAAYFKFDKFYPANIYYEAFQHESDNLVMASVAAVNEDGKINSPYGLGYVQTAFSNSVRDYKLFAPSSGWNTADGKVTDGYCNEINGLGYVYNKYTQTYLTVGNKIVFETGITAGISSVYAEEGTVYVTLDTEQEITPQTCGNIVNSYIVDENGNRVNGAVFEPYISQKGLQGFFFGEISKFIPDRFVVKTLRLICCFALAFTIAVTAVLLCEKYNALLAVCYTLVFLLSPWVGNFSKSVYWVEFTWNLPFIFGLLISLSKPHNKIKNFILYAGVFLSILIKCFCGYEYITFIMMGTILPLLVDRGLTIFAKDKQEFVKVAKRIITTGIVAFAGFVTAIVIHSFIRGSGDIVSGFVQIYEQDILRRTLGGNADLFDSTVARSINATTAHVMAMYLDFPNEIIMGVSGRLFIPLITVSLVIVSVNLARKNGDKTDSLLYILSLVTSITWFILGKQHSYVHPHMNFVCWYYWFIPVMFYIIIKQLYELKNLFIKNKS